MENEFGAGDMKYNKSQCDEKGKTRGSTKLAFLR